MTRKPDKDQPNEYGFSGGATAPEPAEESQASDADAEAEAIAVPDDLGAALFGPPDEEEEER